MAKQARPIFIPGTNMQFPSASAAAKALGINSGNIYSVLAGRRQTAGGYQFGYASNRTIYIPETGRTFSSIKDAAKSVGVGAKKAIKGLEGRSGSAIGGYHFTYTDASKISPPSAGAAETVSARSQTQKRNRKANKQNRIKQQRTKQQKRYDKQQQKNQDYAEQQRQQQQERANYRWERRQAIEQYKNAKSDFQRFLNKVNEQLDIFYERHPNFIHYNPSTPEIFEYMNQIGNKKYTHFDTSLSGFKFDNKATPEDIKRLIRDMTELQTALELATNSHKKSFWDIKVAERERTELTSQFGLSNEGEMDEYADMIWEMIDIFNRSKGYDELGSERVFREVRDAMQKGVDPETLSDFLYALKAWMDDYPRFTNADYIFEILTTENEQELKNTDFWGDDVWTI